MESNNNCYNSNKYEGFILIDKEECFFNDFKTFVIELLYSSLRIQPTNEEFVILKRKLNKFREDNILECDVLEIHIIKQFGCEYLQAINISREDLDLLLLSYQQLLDKDLFLNISIDDHLNNEQQPIKSYNFNVYQLLLKNLKYINSNEILTNKIVRLLLNDFTNLNNQLNFNNEDENEDDEEDGKDISGLPLVLKTIILLLQSIRNVEISRELIYTNLEIIIKNFNTHNYGFDYFNDENYSDKNHNNNSNGNEIDNGLLLKVTDLFKQNKIRYYQIVYKLFLNFEFNQDNRIFKNKEDQETLIQALYINGDDDKNLIQLDHIIRLLLSNGYLSNKSIYLIKKLIGLNNSNSNEDENDEIVSIVIKLFKSWGIPFNLMFEILQELVGKFGFTPLHQENAIIQLFKIERFKLTEKQMESVFKINENLFLNSITSPQDAYYLLELYESKFKSNLVFKIKFQEYPLDLNILESLLYNIESSPVKYQFIKNKLDNLLKVSNIDYIDRFILPHFYNECQESAIYQEKVKCFKLNLINTNIQLQPPYLIRNIIFHFVENESTSMYQKLQLSLVSRDFFKTVVKLINNSTTIPFEINQHFSQPCNIKSEYSLINNTLKYLKYTGEEVISSFEDEDEEEDQLLYHPIMFSTISKVSNDKVISMDRLLLEFKSIEIIDFKADPTVSDFNYFNWLPKLKKLIIHCVNQVAFQFTNEIRMLEKKGIIVQLHLFCDEMSPPTPLQEQFENIKHLDIIGSTMYIVQFFRSQFLTVVPRVKYLTIFIREWNKNNQEFRRKLEPLDEFIQINRFEDGYRLDNLKKLNLQFSVNQSTLGYQFLKKVINCFEKATNLNEIVFGFHSADFSLQLKSPIEIIFKLISTNRSFSNVTKISFEPFYFLFDFGQWSLFNTHSFTQIENSSSNYIQFIRNSNNDATAITEHLSTHKRKKDN